MTFVYAKYFDGNTSIAHNVKVIVTPTYLEINFLDLYEEPILWEIHAIQTESPSNKHYLRLLYGEFPSQILEIENADIPILEQSFSLNHLTKDSFYTQLINSKKNIFLLLIVFIALAAGSYFFLLPRLIMPIVDRISPKREIQLGQLIFNSIIKDEKIDSTKSIIVNNFWKEMHFETSYPIKITVVKNKDINAFALPGGNIVIYDSILSTMTSYEELAALLSHEYIHVRNRHSMQSIVSAYSSLIIIELFLGNTNNTIQSIFQNANAFVSLKYSRNLEKEADNQGMELMYSHQIAPIGMHELFKKLEDSDSDSNNIPEFLNNHPIIKDRLSYSKKYASTHTVKENNKALIELFSSIKN